MTLAAIRAITMPASFSQYGTHKFNPSWSSSAGIRMSIDRRDFMALTLAVGIAKSTPASNWHDALIINALGDLDDPNPPAGEEKPEQRPAVQGTQSLVLNHRIVSDALASGLTAINVTLGYVAGDMEPCSWHIRQIGR